MKKTITTENPQNLPQEEQNSTEAVRPDKAAYMERIYALDAVDQAFMDGFLYARITERKKVV